MAALQLVQERNTKMVRGSEKIICYRRLRELILFSLNGVAVVCMEGQVRFFSELHSGSPKGNGHMLKHGKFCLDAGIDVFIYLFMCIYLFI